MVDLTTIKGADYAVKDITWGCMRPAQAYDYYISYNGDGVSKRRRKAIIDELVRAAAAAKAR